MRQLHGHDASFLYSDTTHSNSNVTLLHIDDQSTAPAGKVRAPRLLTPQGLAPDRQGKPG